MTDPRYLIPLDGPDAWPNLEHEPDEAREIALNQWRDVIAVLPVKKAEDRDPED